MPEKEISIKDFVTDLEKRIKEGKSIDCCKEDLLKLTALAKEKLSNHSIKVNWK